MSRISVKSTKNPGRIPNKGIKILTRDDTNILIFTDKNGMVNINVKDNKYGEKFEFILGDFIDYEMEFMD